MWGLCRACKQVTLSTVSIEANGAISTEWCNSCGGVKAVSVKPILPFEKPINRKREFVYGQYKTEGER